MEQRRAFERDEVQVTVQVLSPVPVWARITDISPTGYRLELDAELAIGDLIVLRVLGHGRAFETTPGRVRWIQATDHGYVCGVSSGTGSIEKTFHLSAA